MSRFAFKVFQYRLYCHYAVLCNPQRGSTSGWLVGNWPQSHSAIPAIPLNFRRYRNGRKEGMIKNLCQKYTLHENIKMYYR